MSHFFHFPQREAQHIRRSIARPEFAVQISNGAVTNKCDGQATTFLSNRGKRRVSQPRDPVCVEAGEPLPVYHFNRHELLGAPAWEGPSQ